MTEIQVIMAALAAGAGVGVGDAAKAAVLDAYTGLTGLLRRRLAARPQAVEILNTEQPDPRVWQARLGPHLAAAGLDHDDEVLAAACRLLELAGPAGLRGTQQPQIGGTSIRLADNHGVVASAITAPVTINVGGGTPLPPAMPEA